MLGNNPAAILAAEYTQKNYSGLPYTEYPASITYSDPQHVEGERTDKCHIDISVPGFPDIYYSGYELQDGLNLVRRFLLDELLSSPCPHAPYAVSGLSMHPNEKIVMLKFDR